MKLLFLPILLLICFELKANTPYGLPRSAVIELKEQSSGRIYLLFIQLPPSYSKKPDQVYPVIYLTDAHYSFPIVSGAMRFPMNCGVMHQAIMPIKRHEKRAGRGHVDLGVSSI